MKQKNFNPADLKLAKEILTMQDTQAQAATTIYNCDMEDLSNEELEMIVKANNSTTNIFPESWITWAKSVIRFFNKFWRRFKELINDLRFADLTIKAVWQEIQGITNKVVKVIQKSLFDPIFAKKRVKPAKAIQDLTAKPKQSKLRKNYMKAAKARIEDKNSATVQKALNTETRQRAKSEKYAKRLQRRLQYS